MKISVFGLGYVGSVTAGCLAQNGHEVIGVDINDMKVKSINNGQSPITEPGMAGMVKNGVSSGRLSATTSAAEAIRNSTISLITVGTPASGNGSLDLKHIEGCCEHIGRALRKKSEFHTLAIRSTVLPGTIREIIIPVVEKYAYKKANTEFGICANPEFLREGTAVQDFESPPFTLIGCTDENVLTMMKELYSEIRAPVIHTTVEVAEIVKYVNNAFHALKICFANEVGNICKAVGIDSHAVMDIFCRDHKLNISEKYLRPGAAFGGSCLPKDLKAITYMAKKSDLSTPILSAILPSNEMQVKNAITAVTAFGKRRIGMYGLSFKPGTDDLRESPMVLVAEYLLGKGYELRIFDPVVRLSHLFGANREFIDREIPHMEGLLTNSLDEIIEFADVLVFGHCPSAEEADKFDGKTIVDLVGIPQQMRRGTYHGLCW